MIGDIHSCLSLWPTQSFKHLHDPEMLSLNQCCWRAGRKGHGVVRAHQVILLGVCWHAPHSVAVGVLGQAVGKLLSSPRLGAIEHDDVPALGKARYSGSVKGHAERFHQTPGDHRAGQAGGAPQGHPPSLLLPVLSKSFWGWDLMATAPRWMRAKATQMTPVIKVISHSYSRSRFGQIFKWHAEKHNMLFNKKGWLNRCTV